MTAREFILKQLNPAPAWNERIISFDFEDLCKYAEAYHEAKVKNSRLGDVSGYASSIVEKDCEHEFFETYFVDADYEPFELDERKCINCGKVDKEI